MIRETTKQIDANIRDEFAGIREDALRHLAPTVPIDHARDLLAQHAPALVLGRSQVLLDTLLSYLMADAKQSLSNAPTSVKNEFYALDLRARFKGSISFDSKTLQFSFDPRVLTGGVAAVPTLAGGGLILGLVFSTVLGRIVAGLALLAASGVVYRVAHSAATPWARTTLEKDLSTYLDKSETQVGEWLAEVDRAFRKEFNEFATSKGLEQGDEG